MIISALIVTWHPDGGPEHLPAERRLTWGPRRDQRQAVVTEAADTQAAEDLFRWLGDQAAVAFVDLVSAQYDDSEDDAARVEDDAARVEEDHQCPQ